MKALLSILLFGISSVVCATEQAETIFKQLAPSLYQIRIIDKASGEKSSIGSGFQISADGLIATNYHVISSYARHPKKYRIEYLDNKGNKAELTLKNIDVVNDLAIVKREVDNPMPFFDISDAPPEKGEEIFSLGNPHDLGMIVVPGTYNGLKKESFSDRIHFTGSVNSGMSGGPVVNKATKVVGINVATSGNQIGFLVPHDKLQVLLNKHNQQAPNAVAQQMQTQLNSYQEKLITTLLNSQWQLKNLGEGLVPTIDVPFIRCWGESNADKKDALMSMAVANCSLEENVFIANNFYTGSLEMEFRYLHARKLSDIKFYQLFQRQIARVMPGNKAGKDDITEFECQHDIVMPSNQQINNKAIFCTRAYKKFTNLYDVLYLAISVDHHQQALISHFTLAGVSQASAQKFTKQFMESVTWK
ncbi:trypsin-like peptidase domain-containing protein [Thalassotalea sp. 1_MG-2023]|uniref:trypsin-like peptidase domain-containing protein n=1 Tax=Thalassotalea sp. 1_MG-2023 TaxID=3062680 RepID=UPI0026E43AE2|nr:trypsin-like peptidase domain-containing protein [Thalassotalea sp. 1_MG-2023]MDO6426121.1 trypsin-like peptidase domain-containing protein [Thalassotalea sp. 1_MG-2023]